MSTMFDNMTHYAMAKSCPICISRGHQGEDFALFDSV